MIICIACRREHTPDQPPCSGTRAQRAEYEAPAWLVRQSAAAAARLAQTPPELLDPVGRELQTVAQQLLEHPLT